jgi:hypothetical protein
MCRGPVFSLSITETVDRSMENKLGGLALLEQRYQAVIQIILGGHDL